MTGNNKMILNNATMQEAVQFWLDSKTLKRLSKVSWITASDSNTFTVSLSELEPES